MRKWSKEFVSPNRAFEAWGAWCHFHQEHKIPNNYLPQRPVQKLKKGQKYQFKLIPITYQWNSRGGTYEPTNGTQGEVKGKKLTNGTQAEVKGKTYQWHPREGKGKKTYQWNPREGKGKKTYQWHSSGGKRGKTYQWHPREGKGKKTYQWHPSGGKGKNLPMAPKRRYI